MRERLLLRFGPKYISVWMFFFTRLICWVGGGVALYYLTLTQELPPGGLRHWLASGTAAIVLVLSLQVVDGMWRTRALRRTLGLIHRKQPVPPHLAAQAANQAITFPARHCFWVSTWVHLPTSLPVYLYLRWAVDAPLLMLLHIIIACSLGTACAICILYFTFEGMMHTVMRHLRDNGIAIDFSSIPKGRLQTRLVLSFTMTILITALLIGVMANQRAADLIQSPHDQIQLLHSLRTHSVIISCVAVLVGMAIAVLLARSVGSRVSHMVAAMRRVEEGDLGSQIDALGNDEIGTLGRSFNQMVTRLKENHDTIAELNVGLERKVQDRTAQLAQTNQRLEQSYQQLKQHDRLKTEFFSNVSHELRTPLTLILTPVEQILALTHELPDQQRRSLQIVQRNTLQLLDLINDLLDFSRLEAGQATLQLENCNINNLVRGLTKWIKSLARHRRIELVITTDPAVPETRLDRKKISKVVNNLLSNALKFTEPGGKVQVQTKLLDETTVEVSVADTGIGIAPADQDKVFKRFVQIDGALSRKYTGTGLGLAMAKEFVELHGGRMDLQSQPGTGSRFFFSLPLIPVDQGQTDPQQPTEEQGDTTRDVQLSDLVVDEQMLLPEQMPQAPPDAATILIVDDSSEVLTVMQQILAADYHIITARDGRDGLNKLTEHLPDLVLSDVMMPDVDGYQFCRLAKADPKTARIPFVLLTAKADLSMKLEGLSHGADDYLSKPFNVEELKARVRSLLRLGSLDQQLARRNAELEKLLEELKTTQQQLIHSEKMRSLGQLVAGLAHEINNSVNAVYNGIKPLQEQTKQLQQQLYQALSSSSTDGRQTELPDKDQLAESFSLIDDLSEVVESGARHVAEIVGDLKKFSHPGQESFLPCDVHQTVDTALKLLSSKFNHRVKIHCDYQKVDQVIAAPGQLTQVFMNILDNAQKAIDGKGDIFVHLSQQADTVTVSIRDTGPGIPPEIRSRIFEPFFTTKEVGDGTGLGLSISFGIITSHGGTIELASQPGPGAEFVVSLPLRPAGPSQSRMPTSLHAQEA